VRTGWHPMDVTHRSKVQFTSEYLLVINNNLEINSDDDVIPSPTLGEEHSKWHRQNPDPGVNWHGPWSAFKNTLLMG
jgi:hypothetical protein